MGVLEHVQANAAGDQTLHVRAADGTLKAAPGAGASVHDGGIVLAWTQAEFEAAPPAAAMPAHETPPADEPTPQSAPTPTLPEETKPDASDPPVDPPAQPRL